MEDIMTFEDVDRILEMDGKTIPHNRTDMPYKYRPITDAIKELYHKKSKLFNRIKALIYLKTCPLLKDFKFYKKDYSIEFTVNNIRGRIRPMLIYAYEYPMEELKCYLNAIDTAKGLAHCPYVTEAVLGIKTLPLQKYPKEFHTNIHCMTRQYNTKFYKSLYFDNATCAIFPTELYEELYSYKPLVALDSKIVFQDRKIFLKYVSKQISEDINLPYYYLAHKTYMQKTLYAIKHPLPEGQKYKDVREIPVETEEEFKYENFELQ